MTNIYFFCLFTFLLKYCLAYTEQGKITLKYRNGTDLGYIVRTMFNNTDISVHIECKSDKVHRVRIKWFLYWQECIEKLDGSDTIANAKILQEHSSKTTFVTSWTYHNCSNDVIILEDQREKFDEYEFDETYAYDYGDDVYETTSDMPSTTTLSTKTSTTTTVKPKIEPLAHSSRQKRSDDSETTTLSTTSSAKNLSPGGHQSDKHHVVSTNHDGPHMFALTIQVVDVEDEDFKAVVVIETKGPKGYISPMEWPLLPFYGVMSVIYLFYGLVWLIMMFMNWRDLLRVQFWIGIVIFIGMLEMAIFFGEFETLNKTGTSLYGALILAEVVSVLKRSLARVLVVIVSLGFGIVKPRLGPMLQKVVAMGTLYFIFGCTECVFRIVKVRNATDTVLATAPLALMDAVICWWIFSSLVEIMRTLRLRRNVVKLSLYRHFTNALIFTVLSSVIYMIWSLKEHKLAGCQSNWRDFWIDDAFWHILFCLLLGVIIVLWRPSANNQRFAFSLLMDQASDEEVPEDEEKLITDAYEGMKKRSEKGVRPYRDEDETDKDLAWIEENIPATVADGALPSILDSDEEVVTTKYEMSKME